MSKNFLMTGLVCLLIFLAPSNLFYKLAENTAYHQGLFIDYLIPKIYSSDLVIIAILGLYLTWKVKQVRTDRLARFKAWFGRQWGKRETLFVLSLILVLTVRQISTPHPLAAIWFLWKISEMIALFFVLKQSYTKTIEQHNLAIPVTLCLTLIFQSLLAVWQFVYQKPLIGYLFFGEGSINKPTGIAQAISLSGREYILPYGTTAHPNILAGVAVIFLCVVWLWPKTPKYQSFNLILKITATLASGVILFLTQSWSALLTLPIVGLLLLAAPLKLVSVNLSKTIERNLPKLALVFLSVLFIIAPITIDLLSQNSTASFSLTRRASLNREAIKLLEQNPIWGVGLNQFTTHLPTYTQAGESIPFIQPVHNVGWLWLAETGLIGSLVLVTVWQQFTTQKKLKNTVLAAGIFLLIAATDHYLLTSQTGLLLVVLTFSAVKLK